MRIFFLISLLFITALLPNNVIAQTCTPACSGGQSCVGDDYGNGICVGNGGGSNQTVTDGGGSNQTVTDGGGNTGTKLINPLKATNLQTFLNDILDFIIKIGTIVVILMLVYVGYLFVVARGVPAGIEAAKKALLWTLVGALILLGAKAIALGIQQTVTALGG